MVRIRRIGPKVIIEQLNYRFRALTDNEDERNAVEESFAKSILWGGSIGALDADGRSLVDISSFILRDAHNVVNTLKRTGQGAFKLDEERSVVDLANCIVFPDNAEFEAILTFTSDEPGGHVRSTAPNPQAVTLVQHHSLIRLPDDGYTPREFDPRMPSSGMTFYDYAAPLDEPIRRQWIMRHRLEKTDPTADRSPATDPIVYYVDRGAPEPIRSALVDGAGWWAEAFEEAGFSDAFRVEVMPEGAHPLDVRYNVIQWVHRSTRGWSYGGSISDPRTGEIIKGHVSLGSLRVRQDRLIFEGLAGVTNTGTGRADDPVQLSLARIRQLAAHEVGHTLGFVHNFAGSAWNRASVMDYPAPLVAITAPGDLDFSNAYDTGIGEWDIHAVKYAYSQFAPGAEEATELNRIVRTGVDRGYLFMSDSDARPLGSAHPSAHLWDNGSDPVAALRETWAVRRIAMDRFGEHNIGEGRPLAALREVYIPVYLHHRYQAEAAIKLVAAVDYQYAVRGGAQPSTQPIAALRQRTALRMLLDCLDPCELEVPEHTMRLLAPYPHGYRPGVESLRGSTSPTFDSLALAGVAADLVVAGLLDPSRCARLIDQFARDPTRPGLHEVIQELADEVFMTPADLSPMQLEIKRSMQQILVERLIELAANAGATPAVRSIVDLELRHIGVDLSTRADTGGISPRDQAQAIALTSQIARHLSRATTGDRDAQFVPPAPPGSPIGADYRLWLDNPAGCGHGATDQSWRTEGDRS